MTGRAMARAMRARRAGSVLFWVVGGGVHVNGGVVDATDVFVGVAMVVGTVVWTGCETVNWAEPIY
ncbi:MAG TPA: hypothetical protein VKO45_01615 [Methanomicrobiales archaeon]|nr:hypothetical protein [Methanomicrobiales archaeon]